MSHRIFLSATDRFVFGYTIRKISIFRSSKSNLRFKIGRCGIAFRSWLPVRRFPASKPDFIKIPPCMWAWHMLNLLPKIKRLPAIWRRSWIGDVGSVAVLVMYSRLDPSQNSPNFVSKRDVN
ncbi:hypothetical protein AVEN_56132-1 [Araneus ventricosus]|uniref:Uncharacterized protein n=1 Tax=Araneus ventricosus TaxID=182803 RepID=A0A4Y2W0G7_ARAVE|nr:hypothetical protein AVEN_56132-1 [Araneus ventricosus]